MNIIVDTHIFLWSLSQPVKLTEQQKVMLETPANTLWLSAASVVEVMIKVSIGKLKVDLDLLAAAMASGYDLLDFSAGDAVPLKDLPFHHKDPFDRMIISQALSRGFHVMTNDHKFRQYECRLVD